MAYQARMLGEEDTNYILSITSDDITITLLTDLFARPSPKKEPRFYTNDYFKLPTSRFNTKKEVYTTVGIYIANVHLIQPRFSKIFGYINRPFTKSEVKSIESKISNLVYNDQVPTDDFADWFNRLQWLGGHEKMSMISPSITPDLIHPAPGLEKLKRELFKKYEKELSPDNPSNAIVSAKIEKELIEYATNYLKQHDGYENFASGAKANINNNYKTMQVMKGALKDCYTGKYRINSSDYDEGISKKEYGSFGDSAVIGAYARAVNTAVGGYQMKQYNQGGSSIVAGPKNSDCKTTKTLDVFIYPEMKNEYLNRYIMDNGVLKELTLENIDKYINTTVKMRSPMYCKYKEPCYCNICIGNQPYLMGIETFGLTLSSIGGAIQNLSMKKFHDLSLKTADIDQEKLFTFD